LPTSGEEILTAEQQAIETIYLGLRQSDGLSADQLRVRHGIDFERVFGRVARAYVADGWIAHRGDRWCLTPEGMLFLDRVAARLIALLD
jgi:oxygen-independent coproporphyrinogen-3 oxidase